MKDDNVGDAGVLFYIFEKRFQRCDAAGRRTDPNDQNAFAARLAIA